MRIDKKKPRKHSRAGRKNVCGFCGESFRTLKLRYKHATSCKFPEGKKKDRGNG